MQQEKGKYLPSRILFYSLWSTLLKMFNNKWLTPAYLRTLISCGASVVGSGRGDEETPNGKTTVSFFLVTYSHLNVQLPRTSISCIYYVQHFHISGFTEEFLGKQYAPHSYYLGKQWIGKYKVGGSSTLYHVHTEALCPSVQMLFLPNSFSVKVSLTWIFSGYLWIFYMIKIF